MKATDPCGFCKKTLRLGDSFHEVFVPEDDPSGREAGKYNNVCGECAGFQPVDVPLPTSSSNVRWCGLCKRVMAKGTAYQRLRFTEGDDVPFEAGLHAMCRNCYEQYLPVVQERLGKPKAVGHAVM